MAAISSAHWPNSSFCHRFGRRKWSNAISGEDSAVAEHFCVPQFLHQYFQMANGRCTGSAPSFSFWQPQVALQAQTSIQMFGFQMVALNGREGGANLSACAWRCGDLYNVNRVWHSTTRSSAVPHHLALGLCSKPTDMNDKQDSGGREAPDAADPPALPVQRGRAAATATVTGGASDLCLTNGCFIIPSEASVYCSLF